jgi:hypothetical protein
MTSDQDKNYKENYGSDEFAEKVQQALDDSADHIDELTLSRIRAARANAVSAADKQRMPDLGWIPAGSLATVLIAVLAVYLFSQEQGDIPSAINVNDMEMLSSVESLELLDDLEFYQWLELELDEELESSAVPHAETLG